MAATGSTGDAPKETPHNYSKYINVFVDIKSPQRVKKSPRGSVRTGRFTVLFRRGLRWGKEASVCPKQEKRTRRQLTYDDRVNIEAGLNRNDTLATISRTIGRAQKVVTAEIRRNWTDDPRGMLTVKTRNICVHQRTCKRLDLCKSGCMQACARCRKWLCNSLCPDFEAKMCPRHEEPPYTCNSCGKRYGAGCGHPYRFYEAKYADDLAGKRRRDARTGIDCEQEVFERAIEVISKGLDSGQSPAHIIKNSDEVPFSTSTFYRLVDTGRSGKIIKIRLRRAVRFKPRKKNVGRRDGCIPRELLKGRTYDDYKNLKDELKASTVEMDTVVGRLGVDKQAILTLYFRRFHFQLFLLLEENTSSEVVRMLDLLDDLSNGLFSKLFPVLLCDRGSEFADVLRMENRRNGTPRTSVFFCDPLQSQQKGGAEKNHCELRKILPKGKTNFDALTGRDMAICMSHVNSYCRKSLDWFSPIELAMVILPVSLTDALGIERVDPREVNLTPYLVPHAIVKK